MRAFFFSIYMFCVFFFIFFFTISGRNICDSLYYDVRLLISLQYCIFDSVVIDRVIYFTWRQCSPEQYRRRFIIQQTVRICFLMETKNRHALVYTLIKKCHRCIYIYIYLTMNNGCAISNIGVFVSFAAKKEKKKMKEEK